MITGVLIVRQGPHTGWPLLPVLLQQEGQRYKLVGAGLPGARQVSVYTGTNDSSIANEDSSTVLQYKTKILLLKNDAFPGSGTPS